ncbi:hypothetical protein U7230_09450 [Carboxydochorda subterranea]|uniref:Uncharacterized protein n=1 Tax=Carboxydichorda subterranea TaxID=3109565 RepID=A0ABZ1BUQ9_9FIRM|nr:hypothetical protein [Limnochorda sp. L945t]WRP16323.1 hypothetical protein U7230_09450 [Limnochorda sp. L945t]
MNATTLLASILGAAVVTLLGVSLQVIIRMVGRLEKTVDRLARGFTEFQEKVRHDIASLELKLTQVIGNIRADIARVQTEVVGVRRDVDTLARRLEPTPSSRP